MTELILSEITLMRPGHCVIGLEQTPQGYRSVRPLPRAGNAWPSPFRHGRGERLRFQLTELPPVRPHVEDRQSSGTIAATDRVSEEALVGFLRQAEIGNVLQELFGCNVRESPMGGDSACVEPGEAVRSICGCDFQNIRFRAFPDRLRVALSLSSGETLPDLPVVDRDWNEFYSNVLGQMRGANLLTRVKRFFNSYVEEKVLEGPNRFARIGLTRPFEGCCWLMLDSLFPLPQTLWLDHLP